MTRELCLGILPLSDSEAPKSRVLAVVRQNIAFSLAVKLAFVILTFAGISSLWGAIAADMGASLLVIFNGLRLLR